MAISEMLNGRELADRLGVDPKQLRHLIRERDLVPSHLHNARYALDLDDQARVAADPAVMKLIATGRRS